MSKNEKLIERFLTVPRGFTWNELTAVLGAFGFHAIKAGKTGGSRRKFVDEDNNVIILHEPHPSRIIKGYALRQVIDLLKKKGKI